MTAATVDGAEPAANEGSRKVLFERLAPIPARHPRSFFPMLPVLGRRTGRRTPLPVRSRFLQPDAMFTPSGAAAILTALRDAGLRAGDEVLVPAYHCPSMVLPILAADAVPRFVPVADDLALSAARLAGLSTVRTRAVLLPHFFGVMQPARDEIRRWCDAHAMVLIEDCAHAFYAGEGADPPGGVGHYAIASTRKFFAGAEGGAVVANGRALRVGLPRASLADELRCAVRTVQIAREYRDLSRAAAQGLVVRDRFEGPCDDAAAAAEAAPAEVRVSELEGARGQRQACRVTQWLVRREPHAVSAGIRRARWQRWREVVTTTDGVDAFVDRLPEHAVPYVFAARLRDPGTTFPALKHAGIQVWRWDRLAIAGCPTARRLGLELVQLPCQQSLPDEAFERLLWGFVEALRR